MQLSRSPSLWPRLKLRASGEQGQQPLPGCSTTLYPRSRLSAAATAPLTQHHSLTTLHHQQRITITTTTITCSHTCRHHQSSATPCSWPACRPQSRPLQRHMHLCVSALPATAPTLPAVHLHPLQAPGTITPSAAPLTVVFTARGARPPGRGPRLPRVLLRCTRSTRRGWPRAELHEQPACEDDTLSPAVYAVHVTLALLPLLCMLCMWG